MAKSVRIIITGILLVVFLIIQSVSVFAIIIKKSNKTSCSGIEILEDRNGNLKEIKYTTSATGATGGIRYRFTDLTVQVGDVEVLLSTKTGGAKPAAGVQEFYDIIITRKDIEEQYKRQLGNRELTESEIKTLNDFFANPSNIVLGSYIEIYNAGTEKILETIKSVDEIYSKAAKYGFPKRNLDDMKSRFSGRQEQNIDLGEPVDDNIPRTGLRPSVIVE